MIYAIQAQESGRVKIGFTSTDADERLRSLQVGSPEELRLVGTSRGDKTTEARLHRKLAGYRLHGEWFAPFEDVRVELEQVGIRLPMNPDDEPAKHHPIKRCSFCGKGADEAKKVISGPSVYICDECVGLCNEILCLEGQPKPKPDPVTSRKAENYDALIGALGRVLHDLRWNT